MSTNSITIQHILANIVIIASRAIIQCRLSAKIRTFLSIRLYSSMGVQKAVYTLSSLSNLAWFFTSTIQLSFHAIEPTDDG